MSVLQLTPAHWSAYSRLMRLEKPIGIYLLLWPTLWALWIASDGVPALKYLVIFVCGVAIMRSAGCVINDYADRNIDGAVKRTQMRPLAAKEITEKEALQLFAVLIVCAFSLVIWLSWQTIALSAVGLLLAASYPFMKRYTHFPQVVLGAAYSWGMPMAFMAVQGHIPTVLWLMYIANLAWTVAYDTMYAMVDRDDDLRIGVKSTAVFFGRFDKLAIALLQLVTLSLLIAVGLILSFSIYYFIGIAVAASFFAYQQMLIQHRERDACFRAFLNNHYAGFAVFIGIVVHYLLR
ncbi:4-hydroxybenzoate octaprenyltransferase [Flocculibacter collagenilyticus]|uniref:4-hydroxybenzoate octaprenyltransferase n=1 Tax=Flocculibacter collagenilyticus TaxID=2744479 RepID=UPI0018F5C1AA|nr:4-hydroxybenzoate octaprenyltransferase [Flocculibacter collagenilyticus]